MVEEQSEALPYSVKLQVRNMILLQCERTGRKYKILLQHVQQSCATNPAECKSAKLLPAIHLRKTIIYIEANLINPQQQPS